MSGSKSGIHRWLYELKCASHQMDLSRCKILIFSGGKDVLLEPVHDQSVCVRCHRELLHLQRIWKDAESLKVFLAWVKNDTCVISSSSDKNTADKIYPHSLVRDLISQFLHILNSRNLSNNKKIIISTCDNHATLSQCDLISPLLPLFSI